MKHILAGIFFLIFLTVTAPFAYFELKPSYAAPKTPPAAQIHRSNPSHGGIHPFSVPQGRRGRYREGEILIKFRKQDSEDTFALHRVLGIREKRRYTLVKNLQLADVPEGVSVQEYAAKCMDDPNVEYAEPNYIRSAMETFPDDPMFPQQYGLHNDGMYGGGVPDADIDAPEVWDLATSSSDVTVAILDTGMDYNHPDLADNIWANPDDQPDGIDNDGNGKIDDLMGWDFVHGDNSPLDLNGHGTHIAGILGATGNNGMGVSGVSWRASLMPLQILDTDGHGSIDAEIRAIEYAVSMGAKIINLSVGGYDFSIAERDAIEAAMASGVLVVSAAGNGGQDLVGDNNDIIPLYPSSYDLDNVIAVASTDPVDSRAPFSNYGPISVDVAAPGVDICSTFLNSGFSCGYSGTSMSTPHVSALAALLWSYYHHFDFLQIRLTIEEHVDVIPSFQGIIGTHGRINLFKSFASLLSPSGLAFDVTGFAQNAPVVGQVVISWLDNAHAETGHRIERCVGNGTFLLVGTVSVGVTDYTDADLIDGTLYRYRVKAFNSTAESPPSQEVSFTTPLAPPADIQASAGSSTSIDITWKDQSSSEELYKLERSKGEGAFEEIVQVQADTTSHKDSGLSANTSYSYRIRAYNSFAGNSEYSLVISVTTPGRSSGGGGSCFIDTALSTR